MQMVYSVSCIGIAYLEITAGRRRHIHCSRPGYFWKIRLLTIMKKIRWYTVQNKGFVSSIAQEAIFSKTIGYGYQLYCWPQEAIDIGLGKIGI